jgi:hypothetical protein
MEGLGLSFKPGRGFHIEGFPDSVKVVALRDANAMKVAALTLHRRDLEFAMEFLGEIEGENVVVREKQAHWRAAIVHFMKCFGKNRARGFRLSASEVYAGNAEALEAFEWVKNVRNKNLVHDENDMVQIVVGAVINKPDMPHKIARVIALQSGVELLERGNWNNLRMLCEQALKYVELEFDKLTEQIAKALEAKPYEELIGMEAMRFTKPGLQDPGLPRTIG